MRGPPVIKRAPLIAFLLLFGLPFLATPVAAETPSENGCINCHQDPKFAIQNQRIYDYYQDWLSSPHRRAGVGCEGCHGGDPAAQTQEEAHRGVLHTSDPDSAVFYRRQPETCGQCHEQVARRFKESRHFEVLKDDDRAAPTCSTCHRAMNRKPYYWQVAESTCRACHDPATPGAPPAVAEKATEILHRLNVTKGYLGWTTLYYASQDWPANTREAVTDLNRRFHDIRARGHNFDLDGVDQASIALLTRLKAIFEQTWEAEGGKRQLPPPEVETR